MALGRQQFSIASHLVWNTIMIVGFAFASTPSWAENWAQNGSIFNPSGIPSLPFSQPRLADLDGDGDHDLILGSLEYALMYFENTGNPSAPAFSPGPDIFASISVLDAEVGVCGDLDDDGDLDLVTGGYHGLQLFENTGTPTTPDFVKVENYFAGLAVGASPAPTLADLDDDGDLDMLVGLAEGGEVKYYPNTGTPNVAEFLESNAEVWFDVGLYAYPWLSDIDGDGDADLLIGRDGTGFYFYRNVGTAGAWQWQSEDELFAGLGESTYWNSPCLQDLTGDSKPDLVYGTGDGPLAYYRNTGTLTNPAWTADPSLFGGTIDVGGASSPFMFDFDGDGDYDLVSGSQLGDIKYYRNVGTQTAPAWQADHARFATIDHSIYSAITVGDLDGDELHDAVVGDLSGNLFFHRNTGDSFVYESSMFEGINVGGFSVPRLIDFDSDGDLDLVVGNEAGGLHYYENQGGNPLQWTEVMGFFGGIDVGAQCAPTLGDLDFDLDLDLVTGDLFQEVQYFANMNGLWEEDPSMLEGIVVGQSATPALCDLDSDGDLDLVIGNYGGTIDYWENRMQNPAGVRPTTRSRIRSLALSAYPNPFAHQTTVRFELPASSRVTLELFDVSGRCLQRLLDGSRGAGEHRIEVHDPRAGSPQLTPGVYFCRLRALGQHETIKLLYRR